MAISILYSQSSIVANAIALHWPIAWGDRLASSRALSAVCELRVSPVDQGKTVTQSKNRDKSKSSPACRIRGLALLLL